MIFCEQVLFIHVPKTGGMSLTEYLLQVLPKPVYYSCPAGDNQPARPGVIQILGLRHESLVEAKEVLLQRGCDICLLPLILAVLRNPYSLEVSRYANSQKRHSSNRVSNQQLAWGTDFQTFAVKSLDHGGPTRPIQCYFLLDGVIPPNLRILRFENLADDLRSALATVGINEAVELPQNNVSVHAPFLSYYTRVAEEAVYQRYKWVFDQGFYSRLEVVNRSAKEEPVSGPLVPLEGPACQIGLASGLLCNSRVRRELVFKVKTTERTKFLVTQGSFPRKPPRGTEIVLKIDGRAMVVVVDNEGPFRWEVPCDIPANSVVKIELSTSVAFCPKDIGVPDELQLEFLLDRFAFSSTV